MGLVLMLCQMGCILGSSNLYANSGHVFCRIAKIKHHGVIMGADGVTRGAKFVLGYMIHTGCIECKQRIRL